MTQLQPLAPGVSPFDAIHRLRPDGSEYWSARELQPLQGYSNWQNFTKAIERAKLAATNTGIDVESAFVQVAKLTGVNKLGDQQRSDYELSRFACYLVAMNGDPGKPEVAAAQAYFAVRAREAEVRSVKLTVELLTDSLAELGFKEHKDEIVRRAYDEHIVSGAARIMAYKRHDNQPKGMETYVQLTIDLNVGAGTIRKQIGGGA